MRQKKTSPRAGRQIATLMAAFFLWAGAASATTWIVGPKAPAMSLHEALAKALDGDTVAVLEGEYDGEVGVITQKRLIVRGIGKRPVLRAGGKYAEGKAIIVVRDGNVLLENLEFRGSRVPDGNGAGVRFEKGYLHVKDCAFFDNEMGLLTGNFEDAELQIQDSIFGEAPRSTGSLSHLLYVGRIARVTITGSRFHEGFEGHLIKSRAKQTVIAYNMIHDGWAGQASYEIDLPNGGLAYLIGNVIGQGPDAQNRTLVAFGAEGRAWPQNGLYMSHNTLISSGLVLARFLRVFDDRLPARTPVHAINNVTAGLGIFSMLNNGKFEGNAQTLGRWLRGPTMMDYALPNDSSLRTQGIDPRNHMGMDLSPKAEFKMPIGTRPLLPRVGWTPGAFQ